MKILSYVLNLFSSNHKKQIYIHIGQGKTGSTAIQNYCVKNRRSTNFYYPKTGVKEFGHHHFSYLHGNKFLKMIRVLKKEILPYKKILISSETFIYLKKDEVKIFSEELKKEDYEIKIIYSYRNQIDSIKSHYFEEIFQGKKERGSNNMNYIGTIEEYFDNHWDSFDHLERIKHWVDFFGTENLITFHYNYKGQKGNLLKDFLSLVDKKVDIKRTINKRIHHSLDPDFADLLILIDKQKIKFEIRDKIARLLKKESSGKTKIKISNELFKKIQKKYRSSNKEFLERYVVNKAEIAEYNNFFKNNNL